MLVASFAAASCASSSTANDRPDESQVLRQMASEVGAAQLAAIEDELSVDYDDCLQREDFDAGGVQVLIDDAGAPWWVKTGRIVPAEIHGACLVEIGGEPTDRSSWG